MRLTSALRTTRWSLTALALLSTACGSDEASEKTVSDGDSIAGDEGEESSQDDSDSFDSDEEVEPPLSPAAGSRDAGKPASGSMTSAPGASTAQKPAVGDTAGASIGVAAPPTEPVVTKPVLTQVVNPFVETSKDPFSTFGADVDTASYDYLRQSLLANQLPKPEYVRVEEYVNYFKYAYPIPAPDDASPFRIALAASPHPMGRSTTLLRVGIQAKAAPVQEPRAAHVVFLVDVSGSMASPEKLPLVKRVLEESLGVLAPSDKVSIVTYAGDTRVKLAPTPVSSRDEIAAVIASLSTGGGTNGGQGMNLAYEQASAGFIQGGINHVVLCTDGDFNLGITSNDALVQLIRDKRATGVTLTALGFGRDNLNDAMMEKVSNAGNGMYSIVFSEDQAIEYANERLLATLVHVAKDMKIQVEFNPAAVSAYRLVGYEDRAIADTSFRDDKVDGGEVGAEHRVTALYEVVLAGAQLPQLANVPALSAGEPSELTREIDPSELVRVKVRSKPVSATDATPASEVVLSLKPADVTPIADPDLAWAAAVASFAELLRKSPYASASELASIESIANAQQASDPDRAEFAQLVLKAKPLMATTPASP
jgi:Ca-activated chloride channel homolog